MKAFRLNDDEVWAANSAEEAVATAIAETGAADAYELEEARELTDAELDEAISFSEHPGSTETTTLRQELALMDEPGLLAATDY